jgi:hypothetical protein
MDETYFKVVETGHQVCAIEPQGNLLVTLLAAWDLQLHNLVGVGIPFVAGISARDRQRAQNTCERLNEAAKRINAQLANGRDLLSLIFNDEDPTPKKGIFMPYSPEEIEGLPTDRPVTLYFPEDKYVAVARFKSSQDFGRQATVLIVGSMTPNPPFELGAEITIPGTHVLVDSATTQAR